MAGHYGTAILPARPRRPKDKAKVEVAVQIAQRWILARLRNHRFFSLAELNTAIRSLVGALNARQMRGFGSSRAELFAEIDLPRLGGLPEEPYAFARWKLHIPTKPRGISVLKPRIVPAGWRAGNDVTSGREG